MANCKKCAELQAKLDQALRALKDHLEWGAKTGSDRDLFDQRFENILNINGVKYKKPEY